MGDENCLWLGLFACAKVGLFNQFLYKIMICCQKQFLSPEFLKLIGLMFDKKYAERKYTLFFMSIYFIRISRLKFAKF